MKLNVYVFTYLCGQSCGWRGFLCIGKLPGSGHTCMAYHCVLEACVVSELHLQQTLSHIHYKRMYRFLCRRVTRKWNQNIVVINLTLTDIDLQPTNIKYPSWQFINSPQLESEYSECSSPISLAKRDPEVLGQTSKCCGDGEPQEEQFKWLMQREEWLSLFLCDPSSALER